VAVNCGYEALGMMQ